MREAHFPIRTSPRELGARLVSSGFRMEAYNEATGAYRLAQPYIILEDVSARVIVVRQLDEGEKVHPSDFFRGADGQVRKPPRDGAGTEGRQASAIRTGRRTG